MANGYQGLHMQPRKPFPTRRVAAGAVAALILGVTIWLVATHNENRVDTAHSNRSSERVFASSGTTSTTVDPSAPTDAATSVPDTTGDTTGDTTAAAGTPAAGNQPAPAPKAPTAPSGTGTSRTTTGSATTRLTVPPAPKAQYIPPSARWTTYSCIASGTSGWSLTYEVSFSGGSGWTAPGGGTTSTEHQSAASTDPSSPASHFVTISVGHVYDTVNTLTRTVALTNATVIHC
jgi:hypothetical protein